MAIPFNLPTDEETEDSYRVLDQLLFDFFNVLRQILLRRHRPPTDGAGGPAAAEAGPAPSGSRQVADAGPLPDIVVSSTLPCRCRCRRRSRRRHRRLRRSRCAPVPSPVRSNPEVPPSPTAVPQSADWPFVVRHLRRLADDFKYPFREKEKHEPKGEQDQLKLKMAASRKGLFSLLVPPQFSTSLWTTLVLLVGWRLLVRGR